MLFWKEKRRVGKGSVQMRRTVEFIPVSSFEVGGARRNWIHIRELESFATSASTLRLTRDVLLFARGFSACLLASYLLVQTTPIQPFRVILAK